jgi:hypothetical protein
LLDLKGDDIFETLLEKGEVEANQLDNLEAGLVADDADDDDADDDGVNVNNDEDEDPVMKNVRDDIANRMWHSYLHYLNSD